MSKKKASPGMFSFSSICGFFLRWMGNCLVSAWDLISWAFTNRSIATHTSNSFDAWCIANFGGPLDPIIKYLLLGIIIASVVFYTPAIDYIISGLGIFIGVKALVDTIRPPRH